MAAVPMEHLVAAVRALDPGGRALLDLSLRRGVTDQEIARVLHTHPAEVALRRARVLDRLAGNVGVNGSADLLETALHALPAEIWLLSAPVVQDEPPRPPLRSVAEVTEKPPAEAEPPVRPEVQERPPQPMPHPPPPMAAPPTPASVSEPLPPPPPEYRWAPPPRVPEPRPPRARLKVAFGGVAVAMLAAAAGVAVGRRLRER